MSDARGRDSSLDDDTAHAKKQLRTSLRAARRERRDTTTPECRRQDGERLADLFAPVLDGAACLAAFEPLDTESNVAPLTTRFLARGRVIVPITLANLDLSWRDLATGEDLGIDGIGLADVILAPALAVGPHGQRLGQGGGCYDRALPRRRPGTPVVAVVFPSERDLDVPVESHDERVDAVLTVDGLHRFADTAMKY